MKENNIKKNKNMLNNKNGITLIALVITIIVMLILVGVTINMAVNGGLFSYAGNAAHDTELAKQEEQKIAEGRLEVDGKYYKTLDDYLEGKTSEKFSQIYTETREYKEIINGVETVTAWIPKGFAVGTSDGINKVADGLVIQDNQGNQFVWIPVPGKDMTVGTMSIPYTSSSYSEPKLLSYDTQANINKYYGTKEDSTTPYFTLETDFALEANYREMAESVNEYGGFYIGRYETTIDSNGKIGSKYNTLILTANTVIKEGQNSNYSNKPFYYRWWGLYYASRHSNVAENGKTVQTNMIWGQQWDKMISYFTGNSINYNEIDITNTYDKQQNTVVPSGTARYIPKEGVTDAEEMNDKIFNIYDLRMNAEEWTAEAYKTNNRDIRGGNCGYSSSASNQSYLRS